MIWRTHTSEPAAYDEKKKQHKTHGNIINLYCWQMKELKDAQFHMRSIYHRCVQWKCEINSALGRKLKCRSAYCNFKEFHLETYLRSKRKMRERQHAPNWFNIFSMFPSVFFQFFFFVIKNYHRKENTSRVQQHTKKRQSVTSLRKRFSTMRLFNQCLECVYVLFISMGDGFKWYKEREC